MVAPTSARLQDPGPEQRRQDESSPLRERVHADDVTGSAFVDPERSAFGAERSPLVTRDKSQREDDLAFECDKPPVRSEHLTPEGFLFWKQSMKVCRKPYLQSKASRGDRKQITAFTDKARRNLRFKALNAKQPLISQFCLTYHNIVPKDGRETKSHLNRFLNKFRRMWPDSVYLWVLEFQGRGVAHYHVFLSLPVTRENHRKLADMWADVVDPSNDQLRKFHLHSRNFINWDMGSGRYLTKYLDKARQKDVPENFANVGRFWGTSRGIVGDPVHVTAKSIIEGFTGKVEQPVKLITRWLGKLHEKQTRGFSRLRRTPNGYTIMQGGKTAFLQILEYFQGLPNLAEPASPF